MTSKQGYIFRCSNSTIDECFERMLFGEKFKYKSMVDQIRRGEKVFLYNVNTSRLYGEFKAASSGKENIVPKAWSGNFPWQVKVKWQKKYEPILRKDFEKFIGFDTFLRRYPEEVLSLQQIKLLEKAFQRAKKLPADEKEFRRAFPAKRQTDDGHMVRSWGELVIDNWLFKQKICHGYERKLRIPENIFCDFFIPLSGNEEYLYVEYWGRKDEKYKKRKEIKIKIYKKHNFPLVELTPKSLDKLDDVMPQKLRRYMKDHKFY